MVDAKMKENNSFPPTCVKGKSVIVKQDEHSNGRPIPNPCRLPFHTTVRSRTDGCLMYAPPENQILELTLLPCIRATAMPLGPWPQNLCCSCSSKIGHKRILAAKGRSTTNQAPSPRDGASAMAKTLPCEWTLATVRAYFLVL